ncbi:MAG: hypothetical protein QM744_01685 [Mesorhizobium sp.]
MRRNIITRTIVLAALMAGLAGCVGDPGYGPGGYDDDYYGGYRDYGPGPYYGGGYYRDGYYREGYYDGPYYGPRRGPRPGWQDNWNDGRYPDRRPPDRRPPSREPVKANPPRMQPGHAASSEAHRVPLPKTGEVPPLYPTQNYRR